MLRGIKAYSVRLGTSSTRNEFLDLFIIGSEEIPVPSLVTKLLKRCAPVSVIGEFVAKRSTLTIDVGLGREVECHEVKCRAPTKPFTTVTR